MRDDGEKFWKHRLTDPPRHVPLRLGVQLLFGGALGFLGWFFLGFGMIFVWTFACHTDPLAGWIFRGELASVPGTLLATDDTNFSEGEDGPRVYAHRYRFDFEGHTYEGVSYRAGAQAERDTTVTVEFPPGRPDRSRIRGMRTAPVASFALFVVIFPIVGALFALGKLRRGWTELRLLKHGQLAEGRLIDKQPTNTEINDRRVYKLTFEYQTDLGQVAHVSIKTHETEYLEDDPVETLVYDPVQPENGTTIDQLPGQPQISEDGSIVLRSGGWGYYFAIVPPALTLIGHGVYVFLRYAR